MPKSQQGDDVVGRKGRIGAICQRELAGRTIEIQGDLILLNRGCCFHIQNRVKTEGIGEIQISAGNAVTVAREIQITRKDVDVSEENGMLPGSPHAQIRIGLEFRAGPFHARIGRREGFDVELQVAQVRRTGGRTADAFLGGDQHARDFQSLCESYALDGHAPGQQPGCRRARQPQRTPHQPTHALRIANPYALGVNADVVAKRALGIIHAA